MLVVVLSRDYLSMFYILRVCVLHARGGALATAFLLVVDLDTGGIHSQPLVPHSGPAGYAPSQAHLWNTLWAKSPTPSTPT